MSADAAEPVGAPPDHNLVVPQDAAAGLDQRHLGGGGVPVHNTATGAEPFVVCGLGGLLGCPDRAAVRVPVLPVQRPDAVALGALIQRWK